MIDAAKATAILSKMLAHESITQEERAELDEYAARFNTPQVEEVK